MALKSASKTPQYARCGYQATSGKFVYIARVKGDGGVDWEWTSDPKQAMDVTPYWQRIFASDARLCKWRGWFVSPTGEEYRGG